jgi:hypothetical protein
MAVVMPRRKKLTPVVVRGKLAPIIPALTEFQKMQLSKSAAIEFSQPDWQEIERARQVFARRRSAELQAIEYRPFESRLKAIADAASTLLTELSGEKPRREEARTSYSFDEISMLLWHELEGGEGSPPPPSPFELVAMLDPLEKAANRALKRTRHWSEKNAWQYDWDMFVDSLAFVFEDHGVKPTAAKSSNARSPKLSPFVAFMWAIIETLPLDLRAHAHSQQGMANAVAKSLKFQRSQSSPAGPNTSSG